VDFTRRGFLKGAALGSGALALTILPGLSAAKAEVGESVLWVPQGIKKPAFLAKNEPLTITVASKDTTYLSFLMSPQGGIRWVAPPSEGIVCGGSELVEICVATQFRKFDGSRYLFRTDSSRFQEVIEMEKATT